MPVDPSRRRHHPAAANLLSCALISRRCVCCDTLRHATAQRMIVDVDGAAFQRLLADSLRLLAAQLGDERHAREWRRREFQ